MLKVQFDPKISLGSILTIIGGIVSMMVFVATLTEKFADYDKRIELTRGRVEEVSKDVAHVREIQDINQSNFNQFREQFTGNLLTIDSKLDHLIQQRR